MAFSATDAAFEGFRVVRRTPMTIVWWSLFYLVFTVLMFGLAGGSMLTMMGAAEQLHHAGVVRVRAREEFDSGRWPARERALCRLRLHGRARAKHRQSGGERPKRSGRDHLVPHFLRWPVSSET